MILFQNYWLNDWLSACLLALCAMVLFSNVFSLLSEAQTVNVKFACRCSFFSALSMVKWTKEGQKSSIVKTNIRCYFSTMSSNHNIITEASNTIHTQYLANDCVPFTPFFSFIYCLHIKVEFMPQTTNNGWWRMHLNQHNHQVVSSFTFLSFAPLASSSWCHCWCDFHWHSPHISYRLNKYIFFWRHNLWNLTLITT